MADGVEVLVAGARGGSDEAFAALVARFERPVYNLIARMVRNPAIAEELAQETFVKAYRRLGTYDAAYPFANWILRIAQNTAIDHLRKPALPLTSIDEPRSSETGVRPAAGFIASDAPDPEAILSRRDLAEQLGSAVEALRPEYRQLVVLRYHEELSLEEIAAMTGQPLGTVKSYLHRARADLAAWFAARTRRPPAADSPVPVRPATPSAGGS